MWGNSLAYLVVDTPVPPQNFENYNRNIAPIQLNGTIFSWQSIPTYPGVLVSILLCGFKVSNYPKFSVTETTNLKKAISLSELHKRCNKNSCVIIIPGEWRGLPHFQGCISYFKLASCQILILFTSLKIGTQGRQGCCSFDFHIYLERKACRALLPGLAERRMARVRGRRMVCSSGRLIFLWKKS